MNKINFEKLGLWVFVLGVAVSITSLVVTPLVLIGGFLLKLKGLDLISRSNDLHSYYEFKATRK